MTTSLSQQRNRTEDERTDELLYLAWTNGDDDAGRQLVHRRLAGIRRFVRALIGGPEYEDAVQEVFIRLAVRARAGDKIDNVRGFIAGIAYNVVREHFRRHSSIAEIEESGLPGSQPNLSKEIVRCEDRKLLLQGLRHMPIDDQILLALRYWEGLGTRQIAEILGANHSTVRTRLQRAGTKLRAAVERIAESPQAVEFTMRSFTSWARGARALVGRS